MRKPMPLRIDPVLLREIRKRAKAEKRTLSEYVEKVLRRDLARKPRKTKKPMIELRGSITAKFGGDVAARSALGISSSSWSRLEHLCNNEPLRQGRHRRKRSGALRDATERELAEVRNLARSMIEAYLHHLDRSAQLGAT